MSVETNVRVRIDLTEAEPDLDPEELEQLTRNLVADLEDLTDNPTMVRDSVVPEGSKSGLADFVRGVLQTDVTIANLKSLLNYLGERFYGKALLLEFSANGKSYKLEYCTKQQLEDAVLAVERLSQIT